MARYRSAHALRKAVREAGYSEWGKQTELADQLDVPRTSLNRWINGRDLMPMARAKNVLSGPWSTDNRAAIENALRQDYSDLLGFSLSVELEKAPAIGALPAIATLTFAQRGELDAIVRDMLELGWTEAAPFVEDQLGVLRKKQEREKSSSSPPSKQVGAG